MNQPMVLAAAPAFFGGLGVAAAILLVGGWVLLQWQRQRHRFELMRLALERGSPLTAGIPLWLVSLRQGVVILTLGVGLLIAGAVARGMVRGVQPPPVSSVRNEMRPDAPPPQPPPPPSEQQDGENPGPPPRPDGPAREGRRPPPPPPANPAMEQWHQAQAQRGVGLIAMGCGFVLILLGIVRVGLAPVERRHSITPAAPASSQDVGG